MVSDGIHAGVWLQRNLQRFAGMGAAAQHHGFQVSWLAAMLSV